MALLFPTTSRQESQGSFEAIGVSTASGGNPHIPKEESKEDEGLKGYIPTAGPAIAKGKQASKGA